MASEHARRPSFRLHPALCAAAPVVFRRSVGFAPNADLWTLLAFHCRAARLPKERRRYSFEADVPCVTVPYEPGAVLAILGEERVRPGKHDRGDYSGNAWRGFGAARNRLNEVDARFPVTVRGGRKRKDFSGSLICQEREVGEVVLRCCAPPGVGYFVLVPEHAFEHRPHLGEAATAALLRLLYFHRGSKGKEKGAKLQHRWALEVTADSLRETGLIDCAPGRVSETFRRLKTALAELELAKVLKLKVLPGGLRLELSRDFFHCEEE